MLEYLIIYLFSSINLMSINTYTIKLHLLKLVNLTKLMMITTVKRFINLNVGAVYFFTTN